MSAISCLLAAFQFIIWIVQSVMLNILLTMLFLLLVDIPEYAFRIVSS